MSTPKLRLNTKKTLLIGFGFFASSLLWSLYNSFVPLLLKNFLESTTIIGAIMTIDNLFGVIFQPLFGSLSDRTHTRIGRRMPYIVIGVPICGLLFAWIPQMSSLLSMMLVIILFNFIMSAWRSPMIALMPDLTPAPLRSKANGIINLMGGLASILAFLLGGKLAQERGMEAAFLMGSLVMGLAVIILFFFVKEKPGGLLPSRPLEAIGTRETTDEEEIRGLLHSKGLRAFRSLPKPERRSLLYLLLSIFFWFCAFNAVETFFTSFAHEELHLSPGQATFLLAFFSLAFVAFAVPAGFLGEKIGRRRTIRLGLLGLVVLFLPLIFLKDLLLIRIFLVLAGALWAFVNINSLPMVVELADESQMGTFTGYYYFFSFGASIVSPILFGFIRDLSHSYHSLFLYTPICYLVALLCMGHVYHGESQ